MFNDSDFIMSVEEDKKNWSNFRSIWANAAYKSHHNAPDKSHEIPVSQFNGYLRQVFNRKDFKDVTTRTLVTNYDSLTKHFSKDMINGGERTSEIARHTMAVLVNMMKQREKARDVKNG